MMYHPGSAPRTPPRTRRHAPASLALSSTHACAVLQAPIFTVIILYFFAVVEGKGVEYATNQVKTELGGILVKNWSVFLPATAINIAYCPPELRVLFLNW